MGLGDGNGNGSRMKNCAVFGARAVHKAPSSKGLLAAPGVAMISMEMEWIQFNAAAVCVWRKEELSLLLLSLPQNPQRCLLVSSRLPARLLQEEADDEWVLASRHRAPQNPQCHCFLSWWWREKAFALEGGKEIRLCLDPYKTGRKNYIGHYSTFRLFVVNIILS